VLFAIGHDQFFLHFGECLGVGAECISFGGFCDLFLLFGLFDNFDHLLRADKAARTAGFFLDGHPFPGVWDLGWGGLSTCLEVLIVL
jgi:hypothetical protein